MNKITNNVPIIFALALDKTRSCEYVVIGEENQVRRRLSGSSEGQVLYEAERPLGTFLFDHEAQVDKDWNSGAIFPLKKALSLPQGRKKYESSAWEFLNEKEQAHDPICVFSAYQCRRWYAMNRTVFGAERSGDQFEDWIMGLTKSFKQIIWGKEKDYSIDQAIERVGEYARVNGRERDTQARIWYPGKRRRVEYLIIEDSFVPAIWYYLSRSSEWGLCVCECDNCGRTFFAPNKHHSLCGEACKKERSCQNKREFDARAREKQQEVAYKNASQRMRNRLNGVRKNERISEEQQIQIEDAFKSIRAEAIQRKKLVKTKEDRKAFVDWLFEQEREFNLLCESTVLK